MNKLLLYPSIVTLGVFIINRFTTRKINPIYYPILFFFLMGITYLSAEPLPPTKIILQNQLIDFERCFEVLLHPETLTPEEKETYKKKAIFHGKEGKRCYNEAQSISRFIPDTTDREKAQDCFKAIVVALGATTLRAKAIAALVSLLTDYGIDIYDQWEKIETKLNWAQYHFGLSDFYWNLLAKAEKNGY